MSRPDPGHGRRTSQLLPPPSLGSERGQSCPRWWRTGVLTDPARQNPGGPPGRLILTTGGAAVIARFPIGDGRPAAPGISPQQESRGGRTHDGKTVVGWSGSDGPGVLDRLRVILRPLLCLPCSRPALLLRAGLSADHGSGSARPAAGQLVAARNAVCPLRTLRARPPPVTEWGSAPTQAHSDSTVRARRSHEKRWSRTAGSAPACVPPCNASHNSAYA